MTPFTVDPADSSRRVFRPEFLDQQRKLLPRPAVKAMQDIVGRKETAQPRYKRECTAVLEFFQRPGAKGRREWGKEVKEEGRKEGGRKECESEGVREGERETERWGGDERKREDRITNAAASGFWLCLPCFCQLH